MLSSKAREHAEKAEELLNAVDTRVNEGPAYGAVRAASATAHALLAIFYQYADS